MLGKHGGYRPGAGRKPKAKTKIRALTEEELQDYALMPIDFMLQVVNDLAEDKRFRGQMAVGAAPYCHRRLAQVDVSGAAGGITINVINIDSAQQLAAARLSIPLVALPEPRRQASDRDSTPEMGEG